MGKRRAPSKESWGTLTLRERAETKNQQIDQEGTASEER